MRPVLAIQHALVVSRPKMSLVISLFALSTQDRSAESEEFLWRIQKLGGLTTLGIRGEAVTKYLRLVSTVTSGQS